MLFSPSPSVSWYGEMMPDPTPSPALDLPGW